MARKPTWEEENDRRLDGVLRAENAILRDLLERVFQRSRLGTKNRDEIEAAWIQLRDLRERSGSRRAADP